MAQLRDLNIDTTTIPGRRLLRFTTVIVNVAAGPFETIGSRPDTSTTQMAVRQRIVNDAGSFREVSTPAVMFWAGDGHEHWHVRDVEAYELIRLDNGRRVGTGAKHGFCYFDNTPYRLWLPGAPSSSVYGGCGRAADLTVTTGLSVGWGIPTRRGSPSNGSTPPDSSQAATGCWLPPTRPTGSRRRTTPTTPPGSTSS